MSIDFNSERWRRVIDNYRLWWKGELDRPLVPITVRDRDPGRPEPDVPLFSQATCTDLTVSADKIVDRIDYELSQQSYYGDAYPYFGFQVFGPGVVAAFLGAELDNSTGRVWFHPVGDPSIHDLQFKFDPDDLWFRRLCDIYAAGIERWGGQVLMSMTDLGGNLDILSTFRSGDKLLLDLYDNPEVVKRLTWEAHEAWHSFYDSLNEILQPINPSYSDWSGLLSDKPSYMLQCDFCYMIGPEMFDEFVKPELEATCSRLANSFYHLDGVGQLPHLDSLLNIQKLKGVQWVPGSGKPDCAHWPEVYRKIRAAEKLIQLLGDVDILRAVGEQLGSTHGIQLKGAKAESGDEAQSKLAAFGID